MAERLHAFVSGRVQGVFFRDSTRQVAESLAISGWTQNLPDGRVEVVAEGERAVLEQLLTFLYRGPELAHVDDLQLSFSPATGEFSSFQIKR